MSSKIAKELLAIAKELTAGRINLDAIKRYLKSEGFRVKNKGENSGSSWVEYYPQGDSYLNELEDVIKKAGLRFSKKLVGGRLLYDGTFGPYVDAHVIIDTDMDEVDGVTIKTVRASD